MKLLSILLVIGLSAPFIWCTSDEETSQLLKLLNVAIPADSPTATVCQLTGQTVGQYIQTNAQKTVVIVVRDQSTRTTDDFAVKSAQLLANRNINVCELSITDQTVSPITGGKGSVLVYVNGKEHLYFGRRSASALLSYVLRLSASHVRLITGKLDKKAYDLVTGPKLIGFFMPSTPDLAIYETVAAKYSPDIPFYLVTDRMVAKHLKLQLVGQINLVKPTEKLAISMTANPATAQDIEDFIAQNKGVVLKYLTEQNVFDPQLRDPNRTTVVAISDRTSAVGHYFHRLLTKVVRNITRENNAIIAAAASVTATGAVDPIIAPIDSTADAAVVDTTVASPINLSAIEIIWIDAQTFPSIGVLLDHIRSQNGLSAGLDAYLGVVSAGSTQWMDTNALNTSASKTADEANLQLLKQWFTDVIANQTTTGAEQPALVNVSPNTAGAVVPQSFLKTPQNIGVREGEGFVLECQVRGRVGDCLWLRDGRNIGSNVGRVSADYRWRQSDRTGGDCSLVVANAQAVRDNGQWICEVTGDQTQPTLTSPAATVNVQPALKKEL